MSHSGIAEALYAGRFAVEISTNVTTWTAVSNATVKVDDIELTRISGEAYVGGSSDYATVVVGKREPVDITLTFLYNEATNGAAITVYDRFHNTSTPTLAIRWSPRGLVGSARAYGTSTDGLNFSLVPITALTMQALDASEGDPYVMMITVRTPVLRQYAIIANPTDLSPAP